MRTPALLVIAGVMAMHPPEARCADFHSDPRAVPKCQMELRRRGHAESTISRISLDNPRTFLGQSKRFDIDA